MAFAFLSWNIEQYGGDLSRLREVADRIRGFDPEPAVFGILEFRAKQRVRDLMLDHFPDYDFGMTDSRQGLELLVGWRRGFFDKVIYSQRRRFQRSDFLRPGGLVSIRHGTRWYNLLFLHADSGAKAADYANRKKSLGHVWNLEKRLRAIPEMNGRSNLIVLGDLNTMGNGASIDGAGEIDRLRTAAAKRNMTLLPKEFDETWHPSQVGPRSNRRPIRVADLPRGTSDLDHVIASDPLRLWNLGPAAGGGTARIWVDGWNQLQGAQRVRYLTRISDHSALYGVVD